MTPSNHSQQRIATGGASLAASLQQAVDSYLCQVPEVREYCQRCLRTERWGGDVVLMTVDAAFTSIGLNYFKTVVPAVQEFEAAMVQPGKVTRLADLASIDLADRVVRMVWRNRRSWQTATGVASYLAGLGADRGLDDRAAFICWAGSSRLDCWWEDPVGRVKGVGINTYQYLRMMGGVDTVMPDKVVRRVIGDVVGKAGIAIPADDVEFVKLTEQVGRQTGYRPIELCWMTWLIQSEAGLSRSRKYATVLSRI